MRLAHPTWPQRLPTWFVVNAATLGPIGRRLPAPGTWGSLAGVAAVAAVMAGVGGDFTGGVAGHATPGPWPWTWTWGLLGLSLVGGYLAVGICGEAEVRLGKQDPGEVILDEFVAMPLCFLGWPMLTGESQAWPAWVVLAAGFGLFRFFDILKPLGISRLQNLPGGWGVVADDLAAALATCAGLHAVRLGWSWVAA